MYYRARYYDPQMKRFVGEDPIGLAGGINAYTYVNGNPLSYRDPLGLQAIPGIPQAPTNVDLNANIRAAERMGPIEFYNQVKPRGPWDYKRLSPQYEDFGNFNYGATCVACGFPETVCKRAPGLFQEGNPPKSWGKPGGDPPYGDDPRDQEMIQKGIDYYRGAGK